MGCSTKEINLNETVEERDTAEFIEDSNIEAIEACMKVVEDTTNCPDTIVDGVGPNLDAICDLTNVTTELKKNDSNSGLELDIDGICDLQIDSYLLTGKEADVKNNLWESVNETYLKVTKEKHERLAKEREDGKNDKKKRRARKKIIGPSSTAGEAIEKILQEKKISTKINYDILKSLTQTETETDTARNDNEAFNKTTMSSDYKPSTIRSSKTVGKTPKRNKSVEVPKTINPKVIQKVPKRYDDDHRIDILFILLNYENT